jgi:enoyl reductase
MFFSPGSDPPRTTTVKALAFSRYGDPDVLEVIEVPEPEVAPSQVRIRVKAAGVQSFEAKLRRGDLEGYVPVTFPQRLGNEFAGVIEVVGAGVSGVTVGDAVLGFTTLQAAAEAISVEASQIAVKPDAMSWEVAGAMSAAGQTAYLSLKALGVGKGDLLLIHAAAGGVGTAATQIAVAWGATVIGTASEANHDYVRSLGAIPVTYGDGLSERVRAIAPEGVDAALDAVGGVANEVSVAVAKDIVRVGTIVDYGAVKRLGVRMLGGDRSSIILSALADMHVRGQLDVHISLSVPMEGAAAAHRQIDSGHSRGRVVLAIS